MTQPEMTPPPAHSPLPWSVDEDADITVILDAIERSIMKWELSKDDARLIVKAVNLHDKLVEALEDVEAYMDDSRDDCGLCPIPNIQALLREARGSK